ncbi:MAG: cell division protein FtsQ/DivIB [Rhodobacteraceae bacterium]|nr:cell division protein FtsQ/DivIB [Paracoccaceae bacterium]
MSSIDPRDPAPSRIKYRMERLWLTPVYRSLIRTGIPAALVLLVLGGYLKDPDTQARMARSVTQARAMIEDRPEFSVKLMRIQGATDPVATMVRESLTLVFPVSSLRLDLAAVKEKVEQVEAVKTADVFLRGGILDVEISERLPVLVWRDQGALELLDGEGARVGGVAHRDARVDLPLIVGKGADQHASEALEIIAAIGPFAPRLRGLQRIGERRWDVVLDRHQRILLPTENSVRALERVVALQRARDVLSRDVLVVDMRDGRRPIIRLSQTAMTELRRLRKIADGEDASL